MGDTGVHYFELTFHLPPGKQDGHVGCHPGYCNNVTLGVICDRVKESVYHQMDHSSEPALHYMLPGKNPDGGWWGMTESGNAYKDGERTRNGNYRYRGHQSIIRHGEPVGLLINRDEHSMRIFANAQPVMQIDGLPDGLLWPVTSPFSNGVEVRIDFPRHVGSRRITELWAASEPAAEDCTKYDNFTALS